MLVWEGSGGVVLLEEVSLGMDFEDSKTHIIPSEPLFLCLVVVVLTCKLSATAPVPCLPACHRALPNGGHKPNYPLEWRAPN